MLWLGSVNQRGPLSASAGNDATHSVPQAVVSRNEKGPESRGLFLDMAEEVRFELTEEFPLRRFSRPLHSTALPLLRRERAP